MPLPALTAALALLMAVMTEPSPPLLQQQRIELQLRLDYAESRVEGTAILRLLNQTANPVTEVPLLLGRLMTLDTASLIDERNVGITRLKVISEVVRFSDWDALQVMYTRVQLPEPVAPGRSLTLKLHYQGRLVPYTETGMLYVRDHVDTTFTVLRSDAYAFPTVGVPTMSEIRAMPLVPFSYRFSITVPIKQTVASAGRVVERRATHNDVTWTYQSIGDVPFLNIPVAPYGTLQNDVVQVFYLPGDSAGAAALLRAATAGFQWLRDHYGDAAGAHRVTVMEIPDGWGSQADIHAGIILEASAFALEQRDYRELYHELSHLWNGKDSELPSPRWNEGLAEYLKNRIAAELDGFAGATNELARSRKRLCDRRTTLPLLRTTPLREFGKHQLTYWSYRVGQLLFMELEDELGRPAFDAAYRQYYQAHRAHPGSVDALRGAFVSQGAKGAANVFTRWMDSTTGLTKYCEAGGGQ